MELNVEQIQAVNHVDGPCLVVSSPGSGKTRVISERAIKLVESGIPSNTILCVTFTNKAAKEMKDRIFSRINPDAKMFIGTFHSLCANLLKLFNKEAGYTGVMSIIDDGDQKDFIDKIIRQLGYDKKEKHIDVQKIAEYMNKSRENMLSYDEIIDGAEDYITPEIVSAYFKQLAENNLCDFSGLLYNTVLLLKNNVEILGKLQDHFKYILVDEGQDTNFVQFEFVKLLGGQSKNIMIVADPDQSIYKFRGARYENMEDFIKEYNSKIISLGTNYRSTPEIIDVADKLIKNNASHMPIIFKTNNPSGDNVKCKGFYDAQDEAQAAAEKIHDYVNNYGWSYSDVVILYRLNRLSLDLQTALANAGVPYTVVGGQNFFDRKEIKDAICLLRFAVNQKDTLAFHRVASLLPGMGDVSIGMIENKSKENSISIMEVCSRIDEFSNRASVKKAAKQIYDIFSKNVHNLNPGDCLSFLIDQFDYMKHLELSCKKEEELYDRTNNVKELVLNATEFSKNNPSIEAYLQNISLISSSDKENGDNSVTLMTIHAVKGLEFPIVFVVGVEQTIMPHDWSMFDAKTPEEKQKSIEEERRILYVSLTRSKKQLHVSYCNNRKFRDKRGQIQLKKAVPSQFLYECGLLKSGSC